MRNEFNSPAKPARIGNEQCQLERTVSRPDDLVLNLLGFAGDQPFELGVAHHFCIAGSRRDAPRLPTTAQNTMITVKLWATAMARARGIILQG
jgi:hypothetical protein